MVGDLNKLAAVLSQAEADRASDVEALAELDEQQLEYLARVDELEDPESDGLEGRCV